MSFPHQLLERALKSPAFSTKHGLGYAFKTMKKLIIIWTSRPIQCKNKDFFAFIVNFTN